MNGNELTDDETIFIKQAKVEFDPFCKKDDLKRVELENKLNSGKLKTDEKALLNFIT